MALTREQMDEHFGFEARDDVEGVLATLAHDVEHDIVGWPTGPTQGREGARPFYGILFGDLSNGNIEYRKRRYGDGSSFTDDDGDALTLIGARLAASLRRLAELEAREIAAPVAPPSAGSFRVKSFSFDDSLFIDDAYLIKGVPGRLLFHLLQVFVETGRRDFTNREIRLEPSIRLPDLKDNLETRLILLRRRLDEKAAPVRLTRPGRGQIRLEIHGTPRLELAGGG